MRAEVTQITSFNLISYVIKMEYRRPLETTVIRFIREFHMKWGYLQATEGPWSVITNLCKFHDMSTIHDYYIIGKEIFNLKTTANFNKFKIHTQSEVVRLENGIITTYPMAISDTESKSG